MPKHVAIIMDGNRRWARAQGKPAAFGHKAGAKTLENIVRYANKIGIGYITVYAFSTENFKRSKVEVDFLMNLFDSKFKELSGKLKDKNIKTWDDLVNAAEEKGSKLTEKTKEEAVCLLFCFLVRVVL